MGLLLGLLSSCVEGPPLPAETSSRPFIPPSAATPDPAELIAHTTRTAFDHANAVATSNAFTANIQTQTAIAVTATAVAIAQATGTVEARLTGTAEGVTATYVAIESTRTDMLLRAEQVELDAAAQANALITAANAEGTVASIRAQIDEDRKLSDDEQRRRALVLQQQEVEIRQANERAQFILWGRYFLLATTIMMIIWLGLWLWRRDMPRVFTANGQEILTSSRQLQIIVPQSKLLNPPPANQPLLTSGSSRGNGSNHPTDSSNALSGYSRARWQLFMTWNDKTRIPIGAAADGPVLLDSERKAHILGVGATGTGKTRRLIWPLTAYWLSQGIQATLMNGRGSDFAPFKDHPNVEIVRGSFAEMPALAAAYLDGALRELERRDRVLDRLGVSTWSRLPASAGETGERLLVIDEFLTLARSGTSADGGTSMMEKLVLLTSEGRKYGFRVLLTATDPTLKALGPEGLVIRGQCARIVFSLEDDGPSKAILGNTAAVGLPPGHFIAKIGGAPQRGVAFEPGDGDIAGYLGISPATSHAHASYSAPTGPGYNSQVNDADLLLAIDAELLDRFAANANRFRTLNSVLTAIDEDDIDFPGWRRNGEGFERLKQALRWRTTTDGCQWARSVRGYPWYEANEDEEFMNGEVIHVAR